MSPSVVALLVSHDGARWLPTVIDGIRSQTHPLARVVAVDTTSRDESPELLAAAFGAVVTAPGGTSFPAAVRLGLEEVGDAEWVWLLHDDSTPEPGALAALLAAAEEDPQADILGPKLREWPSLRRLLELGVTISGTGRRETGLERGEYDQGQHDEVRPVLAVNSAGMLVRRRVLESLGGFDEQMPIFGNDIDFGWRAAAAGHRTLVVPPAVVFHAEAAHRGVRRTPLTGRHIHYQERRAALYTLLANSSRAALPWRVVRLALGTLVRMVGLLLVRQVGQALDELAALVSLYGNPRLVRRARRDRRDRQPGEPADVRPLLAPWWLPYRHGLDFVGDLVTAATNQAADVAERRRIARGAPVAVVDEEDPWAAEQGWVARFLTNPVAVAGLLFVLLALVGAREAFGTVAGGALSPAPASAAQWWQLYAEAQHPLGQGTPVPAPAYLLPMALLGSLLGPATTVSAVLVLATPVAFWGAWRFLRVVGRLLDPVGPPSWLLFLGAATYALVPAASGAWGLGRLGVVVAATVLPWLAHAALGFADPDPDRRWRAAWRTGLLLALAAAFAPLAFWFSLVLGVLVVGAGFWISPRSMRERSVWGPPATALLCPVVLLAPWWVPLVVTGSAAALALDTGRLPMAFVDYRDLVTGHLGDAGAPGWLGLLLLLVAVVALVPARTRIPVIVCWIVALSASLVALALGFVTFERDAVATRAGLGFLVVVIQGGFVVAAVVAALGAVRSQTLQGWWRRLLHAGIAVAAVVPLVGLGWFVVHGPGELDDAPDTDIPAYMMQSAELGPAHGILVIEGDVETGLTWAVQREDGLTLGEDEIVGLMDADRELDADVQELVSSTESGAVATLPGHGIEHIVLPSPADGNIAAVLDATTGLEQASAEDRSTRAWRVAEPVQEDAVTRTTPWWRTGLVALQCLGIVVVAVLCAPTRRGERR
ncbi:glycosyltransferase family 2 protein [Nocardioides coralli]|uniref:glycosyltransferase family 2 protein n=1 Tax=Nocardioides coralli TaxID=2872154 RepID=UPI001CA3BEEE|nr:glycosyltransferase family 2 protein [Nocardioides coralli]QZY30018.1 glycosyltransferase family 2 protein [Nocardioides coralli]